MVRRSPNALHRARNWCFTWNNYPDSWEDSIESLSSEATYIICGQEGREEGKTPHIQGYIMFENARSLLSIRRSLCPQVHWEKAKGKPVQCIDYCKKEEVFKEWGTPPAGQGFRTDIETIRQEIKDGRPELQIAEEHFSRWLIYRKSFQEYRALLAPPRQRNELHVVVLVGHSGVGKTRFVHQLTAEHGEELWSSADPEFRWFDGYNNHQWVLFDDFRGRCPFEFLLRLLDRYPLRVPVKGSFVPWNPEYLFITSNLQPTEWYGSDIDCTPLLRRLHRIISISEVESREEWDILYSRIKQSANY